MRWIGKGVKQGGVTEHTQFSRGKMLFAIGNIVRLQAGSPHRVGKQTQEFYVGEIRRMWQDEYRDKWVSCAWYYFPEEVRGGRKRGHHDREVFRTEHVDDNPAEAVMGHAAVLSVEAFDAWLAAKPADDSAHTAGSGARKTRKRSRGGSSEAGNGACAGTVGEVLGTGNTRVPVFLCRRHYDSATRMMLPLRHPDAWGPVPAVAVRERVTGRRGSGDPADATDESADEEAGGGGADGGEVEAAAGSGAGGADADSDRAHGRPHQGETADGASAPQRAGIDGAPQESDEVSALRRACRSLQLSAVPPTLPCRGEERKKVSTFLRAAVSKGGLGCALYISGMPGTGKTATVKGVVAELQAEQRAGKLPPFKFIEVNAMKLAHPYHAYTEILTGITGQRAAPRRAAQLLDERFSSTQARRGCVVLLADELDFLVTRKQTVLYNLFDWPTRPGARLVVIGIANTMDLPERLLPRISSRVGMGRIVFRPYTVPQIRTIVRARVQGLGVFDTDALEMCARRVAALSGDVRRALMICRRAAELVVDRCSGAGGGDTRAQVTLQDVMTAARDMNSSSHLACIAGAAPYEQALLAATALQLRATGIDVASLEDVLPRAATLCRLYLGGLRPLAQAEALAVCATLVRLRLLAAEASHSERLPLLRLAVSAEDVVFGLRDTPLAQVLDAAPAQ